MRVGFVSIQICSLLILPVLFLACSKTSVSPTAVVPTIHTLPYSARVMLTQAEGYLLRPGATMTADPTLANHVTGVSEAVSYARPDWERAILQYLDTRKTFARVTANGPSDLDLVMHMNVYIDPGVHFHFKHVYVARIDASVIDPQTHLILLSYMGQGKAAGEVSRDEHADEHTPINQAVQMALNDLFGKIERDSRMLRLAGS